MLYILLGLLLAGTQASNSHQKTAVSFGDRLRNVQKNAPNTLHAPEVAFQCGYRNKYIDQSTGQWISDKDIHATCMKGKLDILKYCRKVYPHLQITNIVEAESLQTIADWCKVPDGLTCKWSFVSKPYKCLVGEFESEALLVPQGCHFGHVDDRSVCKDFEYWNRTAQLECSKRLGDLNVESFSMLEPCGLDMFSGVEYVCCPKVHHPLTADLHVKVKLDDQPNKKNKPVTVTLGVRKNLTKFDDDDDDDDDDENDDDDDDDDEQDIETTNYGKTAKIPQNFSRGGAAAVKTSIGRKLADKYEDDSSEDSDEDSSTKSVETLDIYFRVADPDNEHEAYQQAIERLERKHKNKVATVMQEWSELEKRYNAMLKKDPKHAQTFRHEMTTRFQKTISALEAENKEQRRQIDDVHQQRVESLLNERKRDAIKRYRDALADRKPSAPKVLHHLESYIRAEEKDRVHALNRFIHLLKTDSEQALQWKPTLLRKLHDIDLRINGTISLLKNLPAKSEEKIKTSALDFWRTFRREHTPDVSDKSLLQLDHTFNDRLLEAFEKQYKSEQSKGQEKANQIAIDSIDVRSKPVAASSKSSAASASNTTNAASASKENTTAPLKPVVPLSNRPKLASAETARRVVQQLSKTMDNDAAVSSPLSSSSSSDGASGKVGTEDVVVFDPVIEIADGEQDFKESKSLEENNAFGAYAKQSARQHQPLIIEEHYEEKVVSYGPILLGIAVGAIIIGSVIIGILFMGRRIINHRQGFIEVDACTPEERHVALMQGNGYENPTYKYFDEKI